MQKLSLVHFLENQYTTGRKSFLSLRLDQFDINSLNECSLNAYLFILQHKELLNFSDKQIHYLITHSTFYDSQMVEGFSTLGAYLLSQLRQEHKYLNASHLPLLLDRIYRSENAHNKFLFKALSIFEKQKAIQLWEGLRHKPLVIDYIDKYKEHYSTVKKLSLYPEIIAYKEKEIIRKVINQRDNISAKYNFKL